jgi:hypothetical protein
MPIIQIKSLAIDNDPDIPGICRSIARDFAVALEIPPHHISVTWETLAPGHHVNADISRDRQPRDTHPILVDLLVPDFHKTDAIEKMLTSIAGAIAEHADIPGHNVFINCRYARSGMVLENGEILHW